MSTVSIALTLAFDRVSQIYHRSVALTKTATGDIDCTSARLVLRTNPPYTASMLLVSRNNHNTFNDDLKSPKLDIRSPEGAIA